MLLRFVPSALHKLKGISDDGNCRALSKSIIFTLFTDKDKVPNTSLFTAIDIVSFFLQIATVLLVSLKVLHLLFAIGA